MNATLPAHVCPPACTNCRLRKTGAFTAVKPEVLDFIQGFRSETMAVEAGGALVRENQTNCYDPCGSPWMMEDTGGVRASAGRGRSIL